MGDVSFDQEGFLHESQGVTRKRTIAYMLLESNAFPHYIKTYDDLRTTLDLYFRTLSLIVTSDKIALIGAVLANGGVNPFTYERLFNKKHVRNVLSIMSACGMYDYSGEFTFRVGIPAQSCEGGGILCVIPKLGGFCTYSPRVDKTLNSVRGINFCCQLTREYNFHAYETLIRDKKDPSVFGGNWNDVRICNMFEAASRGDLVEVRKELDCLDINCIDYDRRTVLHVAAENNRKNIVYYLLDQNANITLRDRWGHTAFDCTKSRKLRECLSVATPTRPLPSAEISSRRKKIVSAKGKLLRRKNVS